MADYLCSGGVPIMADAPSPQNWTIRSTRQLKGHTDQWILCGEPPCWCAGKAAVPAKTAAPAQTATLATCGAAPPGDLLVWGLSLALSSGLGCNGGSRLTSASTSQVQVILLPQPPKLLGLQNPKDEEGPHNSVSPLFSNWEIPSRADTWVTSMTLLAGAAVLLVPGTALPNAEYTGWTGSAGPIPTRKTAIGSTED
ncbi:hypothetical protein AAY473_040579 [Plecturocebus cupreus]